MTLLVSSEGPLCTASVLEQTTASQSTAQCIELHCREDLALSLLFFDLIMGPVLLHSMI